MPVTGRVNQGKTSIVRNPPILPIPIYFGGLNLSVSFEGHPSAGISYEGIVERDIPRYEATYVPHETQVEIEGIKFVVESYGYDAEYHPNSLQPFSTYKVSIALKSLYEKRASETVKVFKVVSRGSASITLSALCAAAKIPYIGPNISLTIPPNSDANLAISVQDAVNAHARINGCYVSWTKGCQLLKFDSGARSWNFPISDVITDGQNTRSGWNGYRDTELTWGNSQDNPESTTPTNGTQFTKKAPVVERVVEEDAEYASPPPGTYVLKDLSSTCDESSPTKTRKITTTIDGTPEREEVEIWKFCYTAADIWDSGQDMLFSATPEAFWQVVERQVTEYIYESLPATTLTVRAKDPNPMYAKSGSGPYVTLVVDPDYAQFASASPIGGSITFQTQTKYLTQVLTTTTKKVRLAKESEGGEIGYASLDTENPFYDLVRYKTITGQQKQAYLLKSTRKQYGADVGSPFSVEWKKYDELPEKIKNLVSTNQNVTSTGMVGVLTPDPSFKEPMFIATESKTVNSFLWAPNPNSDPPDAYLAPLTTGEESYYQVDRTIIAANKYRERTAESSFQESGFSTGAERVSYKEVIGRPPEASTRDVQWEKKEAPKDVLYVYQSKKPKTKKYFLKSDLLTEFTPIETSKGYPEATTFQQALLAAKLDLRIKDLQSCQASKKVSWYYPNVQDGDVVTVGRDRFSRFGRWRVTGASWALKYSGTADRFGLSPICECDGTNLTLGCDHDRNVTYSMEEVADAGAGDGASGEPKLETTGGGTSNTLGMILIDAPNRRRF